MPWEPIVELGTGASLHRHCLTQMSNGEWAVWVLGWGEVRIEGLGGRKDVGELGKVWRSCFGCGCWLCEEAVILEISFGAEL